MTVPDTKAFADLICDYSLEISRGDQVLVDSPVVAQPFLLELQKAILEREAWPLFRLKFSGQEPGFYRHAKDVHLEGFAPLELHEYKSVDRHLRVIASQDPDGFDGIDPGIISRATKSRAPLLAAKFAIELRSLTYWPTEIAAARAGITLDDLNHFVNSALFLDKTDPVAEWKELQTFQARLIDRLSLGDEIRIEAPGTDLTLRVKGRTWINSAGKRNMPSGEIFTGPLEDSANGTISFHVPSAPAGVSVRNIRLTFKDGIVVEHSADEGTEYLTRMLDTDPGARRLGEIGIGTNFGIDRPVNEILFDEKIGGTVHLAIGNSYPESGGTNTSSVHWDMICDLRLGGRLSVDGEVFQENGVFATV